jgi:hypothetical protein
MEGLPTKTLLRIFELLEPKELSYCAKTCKLWRDVAYSDTLWNKLVVSHFPSVKIQMKRKRTFSNRNWREIYISEFVFQQTGIEHDFDNQQFVLKLDKGKLLF